MKFSQNYLINAVSVIIVTEVAHESARRKLSLL